MELVRENVDVSMFEGLAAKKEPNRFKKMAEPFTVKSNEGDNHFQAGDYLVTNLSGSAQWGVQASYFENEYEVLEQAEKGAK